MAIKFLHDLDIQGNIDLNNSELQNAKLQQLGSDPGTVVEGMIFQNTASNVVKVGLDGAWVELSSTVGDITSVVAGAGMTGGATSGAATLNVIGGQSITVNANDVAITAGGVDTTQLADDSVTEAKLANALLAEIDANTAKNTNVSTSISEGQTTNTTVAVNSSDGGNATLASASTTRAGLLSKAKFDEIVANSLKATDVNHNVSTNLGITGSTASRVITSSDGDNVTIPAATTSVSGVMTAAQVTALNANTAKNTNATHSGEVTGSGALTIASNVVDEANLKVSNGPTNGHYLTAQSGNTGGLTWAAIPTLNQDTTGNADTATALETPRAINGVNFDGSAPITVTAAAGTLTGNTLKSTVVASSLTSVGTIATGAWNATVIPSAKLDADTAHLTTAQTFTGSKTMGTNTKLNFRDANSYIYSPSANDIEAVATTITLDASNDIQLQGHTTVTGNFSVSGTLNVDGNTTTIDSTTVAIADSMLKLAKDQGTTDDLVDFGLYGQYGVGGTAKYAGLFRDQNASGAPFVFFDNTQTEPGATVNKAGTGFDHADVQAGKITSADGFYGDVTGDVTGNADTVTTNANLGGHITSSGNTASLGSFTSAHLKAALTNETGSGAAVFATSPTLVTPALGTPSSGVMTNATGTASGLNIGGNAATSTKISSITNTNIVQLAGSQTLTGTKTLNSFKGTGGATVTNILDEDAMGSNSATALATQQSIKAYVDDTVAGTTSSWVLNNSVSGVAASNSNKTYTITHGMGTSLLYMIQVIQTTNGTVGATVFPDVTRSTTTAIINFNVAPTAGDYTVVIVKI